MKILHIITTLSVGGAEVMLVKLLKNSDLGKFPTEVICLARTGELGRSIEGLGIKVRYLEMNPRLPNPIMFFRLVQLLRKSAPDLVQTWMYHSDLLGGIAAKLARVPLVVWNIRNGSFNKRQLKFSTRLVVMLSSFLSRQIPNKIVSCSKAAITFHKSLGYRASKFVYLPNGFDVTRFSPNTEKRNSLRKILNIPNNHILIGMFARFHPQKDFESFIQAARRISTKNKNVQFVLAGEGIESTNSALYDPIKSAGMADIFLLLGLRSDLDDLYNTLDIFTLSSSFGEGFPNVVGEAMSCGIPVVATTDGDTEEIIGDAGATVPTSNPSALAQKWEQMISLPNAQRKTLGENARKRILDKFEISKITQNYYSLYVDIASN
jgi:glycosyltransferase involved in cell wall biosynthesis